MRKIHGSPLLQKQFQYMYHSYQPYTGNTGLSNCILDMGNFTACAHVHVTYGTFLKIISTRKLKLKFIFVGQNILAHW